MSPPVPTTRVSATKAPAAANAAPPKGAFEVDLPAGGRLTLDTAEEVQMWNASAKRYLDDYGLAKANDLLLLGAILSQAVAMYRAQKLLADPKKASAAVGLIGKASEQIRDLEKALGIDKKSREAGGQHNVAEYVTRLKRAAHEKGVRITDRVKAYEAFNMELRQKIRVLRNGDEEDRAYEGVSLESIVDWAERELAKIEEADKTWAQTKGALFVGKL